MTPRQLSGDASPILISDGPNASCEGRRSLGARIGFALLSNSHDPIPSTRIACLNIFPALREMGFEPRIVHDPRSPDDSPNLDAAVNEIVRSGCSVVVLQKIRGPAVHAAIARLRLAGIRTIYLVCDFVDNEMAARTDATIVVTKHLKSLYAEDLRSRIFVVHDGIEQPDVVRREAADGKRHSRLLAAMVTSHEVYRIPAFGIPPSPWSVELVGRYAPSEARMVRLKAIYRSFVAQSSMRDRAQFVRFVLHPRLRRTAWSATGVYDTLASADAGVIPIDTSGTSLMGATEPPWRVKSENRLTLMMAIGLPVIATPIPAYEEIIKHGENGFFARSRADWLRCFAALEDQGLRRDVGERARADVLTRFSIQTQAERFAAVLNQVRESEVE